MIYFTNCSKKKKIFILNSENLIQYSSSCCLKFFFYYFSVFIEATVDATNSALATNPQFFANHANETFVVRNKDHAAFVIVDGVS